MPTTFSSIEFLESRIAPAAFITFQDVDGDTVKISSSKGTSADLTTAAHITNGQLTSLDLSAATWGSKFIGAQISVAVSALGPAGDGIVDVGFIDGTGVNLGSVAVKGDLGRIVSGVPGAPLGIKSLTVNSLGARGVSTGAASLVSTISGGASLLHVLGNVDHASVTLSGNLGALTVGGSLIGGTADNTGQIEGGTAGAINIGGSLIGGAGLNSAQIGMTGKVGAIKIGGLIIGDGPGSGSIFSNGAASFSVGGAIAGGGGNSSGAVNLHDVTGAVFIGAGIIGGGNLNAGSVFLGKAGTIHVVGNITGSSAENTGLLDVTGKSGSITIDGSIQGGAGKFSGAVVGAAAGAIKVGGNIVGGGGQNAGLLSFGTAPTVVVGGAVGGGGASGAGSIICNAANSIKVAGYLTGGSVSDSGMIDVFFGIGTINIGGNVNGSHILIANANQPNPFTLVNVSITIAGSVADTNIIVGNFTHPDVQIGAFTVHGDWTASNLIVGAGNLGTDNAAGGTGDAADNVNFGDSHDTIAAGSKPKVLAKVGSITIGGRIFGTIGGTDHFGFVAEQIGSFHAGGTLIPTTAGPHNDNRIIAASGDVTIHEV